MCPRKRRQQEKRTSAILLPAVSSLTAPGEGARIMSRDPQDGLKEDILLGMDRPIARRDFLQGAALGIAGTALGGCPGISKKSRPAAPGPYPPELMGLRGQDMVAAELGHRVRNGDFDELPADVVDTGEDYDLVVVGAGLAGLTAAYVYHREMKGRARILILDNHDDFGGHAKRNTFNWEGMTLVGFGGTYAIEEPEWSPPESMEVMKAIGIDFDQMESWRDWDFAKRFGLSSAVFFDERVYADIKSKWVAGFHTTPYEDFFARSPLPAAAQRELVEFYTTRRDYLPDVEDKERALSQMSWETFIREGMGLGDETVRFANLYAPDLIGLGCDAVSAASAYHIGPGFFGMGGEGFYDVGGMLQYAYEPIHRFPDGNHTMARLLLKEILSETMPGAKTMEEVFNARLDYGTLDKKESPVRLRLRSMAVRIKHEGPLPRAEWVTVHYTQPDGRVFRVRARGAVMAGWGMVAKRIVPEISGEQFDALDKYRYTSAVYINVMLRQWRAIAEAGGQNMYFPGGYCTTLEISSPLHVGSYQPEYHPDKPILLTLFKYLYEPGLDVYDQVVSGRLAIEDKPFEEYEWEVRKELQHLFGGANFNAADDILGITVNRWGHGYNFFSAPVGSGESDVEPYVRGRQKVGRISFAGADAGGSPWSQLALQYGYKAAFEQLSV